MPKEPGCIWDDRELWARVISEKIWSKPVKVPILRVAMELLEVGEEVGSGSCMWFILTHPFLYWGGYAGVKDHVH